MACSVLNPAEYAALTEKLPVLVTMKETPNSPVMIKLTLISAVSIAKPSALLAFTERLGTKAAAPMALFVDDRTDITHWTVSPAKAIVFVH